MKYPLYTLLYVLLYFIYAVSGSYDWVWMGGSPTSDNGFYGDKGVGNSSTYPKYTLSFVCNFVVL